MRELTRVLPAGSDPDPPRALEHDGLAIRMNGVSARALEDRFRDTAGARHDPQPASRIEVDGRAIPRPGRIAGACRAPCDLRGGAVFDRPREDLRQPVDDRQIGDALAVRCPCGFGLLRQLGGQGPEHQAGQIGGRGRGRPAGKPG